MGGTSSDRNFDHVFDLEIRLVSHGGKGYIFDQVSPTTNVEEIDLYDVQPFHESDDD